MQTDGGDSDGDAGSDADKDKDDDDSEAEGGTDGPGEHRRNILKEVVSLYREQTNGRFGATMAAAAAAGHQGATRTRPLF